MEIVCGDAGITTVESDGSADCAAKIAPATGAALAPCAVELVAAATGSGDEIEVSAMPSKTLLVALAELFAAVLAACPKSVIATTVDES